MKSPYNRNLHTWGTHACKPACIFLEDSTPYVALLFMTDVVFSKINRHRQDRGRGNMTRRSKHFYAAAISQWWRSPQEALPAPVLGSPKRSTCRRMDLLNFKSTH